MDKIPPGDNPSDARSLQRRAEEDPHRSPAAEALMHPVDPDNLRDSIREAVRESPIPYIRLYADGARFGERRELTEVEQESVERLEFAVDAKAKSCYRNSKLALSASDLLDGEMNYVEGVIASPVVPNLVTHAWVEVNGVVIDLTMDSDDGWEYYGMVFPEEEVLAERQDGSISGDPVAFQRL